MANKFLDWFRKNKKGPGLDIKFKKGNYLPWRGITFEISAVGYDFIILKPVGLTGQFAKKLHKAR